MSPEKEMIFVNTKILMLPYILLLFVTERLVLAKIDLLPLNIMKGISETIIFLWCTKLVVNTFSHVGQY